MEFVSSKRTKYERNLKKIIWSIMNWHASIGTQLGLNCKTLTVRMESILHCTSTVDLFFSGAVIFSTAFDVLHGVSSVGEGESFCHVIPCKTVPIFLESFLQTMNQNKSSHLWFLLRTGT